MKGDPGSRFSSFLFFSITPPFLLAPLDTASSIKHGLSLPQVFFALPATAQAQCLLCPTSPPST